MPTRPVLARLAAAALATLLLSCGGSKSSHAPPQPGESLLRHVPADTPVLIGILEPVPPAYLAMQTKTAVDKLDQEVQTLDHMLVASDSPDHPLDPGYRFLHEAIVEMGGHFNAEALAKLGIGADTRGVMFAVDLAPVALIEVHDGALLRAAVERIAARANVTLPLQHRGDREYWMFELGKIAVVAALRGNELTVALLPTERDALLAAVLDGPAPGQNLAETGKVAALLQKYHWQPWSVGFFDLGGVAKGLAGRGPVARMIFDSEADCATEIAGWFADWPRLAFGVTSYSEAEQSGMLVIETSPETTHALAGLTVPIPGWSPAGLSGAKFELGIGLNAAESMRWFAGFVDGIGGGKAAQCPAASAALGHFASVAQSIRGLAGMPFADLRGLSIVLHDLDPEGGVIRAAAVLGVPSPDTLLGMLDQAAPGLLPERPTPGGPPVRLEVPDMGSGLRSLHVAASADALAISVGDGVESGLQAMLAQPRDPAAGVLLRMRADRAFVAKLQDNGMGGGMGGDEGPVEATVEVGDGGVIMRATTRPARR